jgi:hypothetical protein
MKYKFDIKKLELKIINFIEDLDLIIFNDP